MRLARAPTLLACASDAVTSFSGIRTPLCTLCHQEHRRLAVLPVVLVLPSLPTHGPTARMHACLERFKRVLLRERAAVAIQAYWRMTKFRTRWVQLVMVWSPTQQLAY